MKEQEQLSFLNEQAEADNAPVVCLGMTFKNDGERREFFRNELRKKLPELKQIEGFPIGEDEDIIALSDPPYYTACPNPWINDFIDGWEREKVEKYGRDSAEEYNRKPFSADVSEGKNDPVYNAHSYHTKVPHKAIMRYILNYTNPGDIIFDGFSGTGMTGVASQLCGDFKVLESMGYQVLDDGTILDHNKEEISKIGARKSILGDLSPAATFISYNYNSPFDSYVFEEKSKQVLEEVTKELGWMYETQHTINNIIQRDDAGKAILGQINYTVWSDIFICPNCSNEIIFWDAAVDTEIGKVKDQFLCEICNAEVKKRDLERAWEIKYDDKLKETVRHVKQAPVLINYSVGTKRFQKVVDEYDLNTLRKIENFDIPYWFPTNALMKGEKTIEPIRLGITNAHHFYTKSSLAWLAALKNKSKMNDHSYLVTHSIVNTISKLYRYVVKKPDYKGQGGGILSGTLYVPSLVRGLSAASSYKRGISRLSKIFVTNTKKENFVIQTSDSSAISIPPNSIDYIFIDPPFGANLMYSELNFLWESWLKVNTNQNPEAIANKAQNKNLNDYKYLMTKCFEEAFRILKPGRWMTVEFSNSQASVWNAIQESIQQSGFVVANVSALDKKQGSFNAVTSTTAVKQDLVISAYKPKKENIEKMKQEKNTENSTWIFISQHLEQLPVFLGTKGEAQIITERTPRILFDRMVAYHVQNNMTVPISSADFQSKIAQIFPMRDGMAFLESQVAEYDRKRTLVKDFAQMSLFVSDENSAIEWIRQQLLKKPQTRQEIHPQYMKEIQHIAKHEQLPELDDLLHQNFLKYESEDVLPDQVASYLRKNYKDLRGLENDHSALKEKARNRWYVPDPNKQADLEKLREKSLLREFAGYVEEMGKSKKKMKQFRTEAIRAGFKKAWSEKDYEKIVQIGERLPESVIQEDDKLLMYFDNAQIRLGL